MERQRWLDGTLYSPNFEQDSCGFGLIAQIDNQPSHTLVQNAIGSLACMTHRGAIAADGLSGDGCPLFKTGCVPARWQIRLYVRTVAAACCFCRVTQRRRRCPITLKRN
jgi:hypothetical protein